MSTFNIRGFVRAACFGDTPTDQLLAQANKLRGEGNHGFADLAIEELKRRTLAAAEAPSAPRAEIERDDFVQVVSMSAEKARAFIGGRYANQEPLDLGPADADRYKLGARVWGFRRVPVVAAFVVRGGQA